jgi:hypothetical protein
MDQNLKTILVELLASEDATGCSEDLTVVANSPVRQLRRYLGDEATERAPVMSNRKHHWHIEMSLDGLVHLTLAQPTAGLVASALEIVHPDQNGELRNARALALALQNLCTDG